MLEFKSWRKSQETTFFFCQLLSAPSPPRRVQRETLDVLSAFPTQKWDKQITESITISLIQIDCSNELSRWTEAGLRLTINTIKFYSTTD